MNRHPADSDASDRLTCEALREELGVWIDGELSAAEAKVVERHISGCTACRKLERKLREDWSLLERLPAPPIGDREPFLGTVRRRIRAGRTRVVARLALALSAAAALLFAVLFIEFRPTGNNEAEFLDSLPILVDIREETRDLDADFIGLLLEELDPGDEPVEFEFFLEEELEGTRS